MEYEAKQAVHLPVLAFLELELHLLASRPGVTPEKFVTELVSRWLETEKGRSESKKNGPAIRGFQWKNMFLPDGTILRTSYGDTVEFAKVVGDHIVENDGTASTPSMFANRHARGRNAWRFVWLRFPGDDSWVRADHCRERDGAMPRKQSKAKMELSKPVHNADAG